MLACKRHVVELGVNSMVRSEKSHVKQSHFIFAGDDLPTFSRILVAIKKDGQLLPSMGLSIIIGDEIGTIGEQGRGLETPADGNHKELLSATTKNAAASHKLANESLGLVDLGLVDESNVLICGHVKGDDSTMVNKIKEAKSKWSQQGIYVDNRRVRSLLEPLRHLYELGNLYIDAPISWHYWLEVFTSLSGPQPSVHVLFAAVYTSLDEAIVTYESGDMAFAILKLKGVMDTMNDLWEHCRHGKLSTVVVIGKNSGLTYWDAHAKMQCLIWNKLARASLNFSEDLQQVRTAWRLTQRIIDRCRCYRLGCKVAELEHDNVSTLITMAWEALDQLGEYNDVPRSHALRDIVESLRKAVRREPENAMLMKELQWRLNEKQEAEMAEDVRKMENDEGKVMSRHLTKRRTQ